MRPRGLNTLSATFINRYYTNWYPAYTCTAQRAACQPTTECRRRGVALVNKTLWWGHRRKAWPNSHRSLTSLRHTLHYTGPPLDACRYNFRPTTRSFSNSAKWCRHERCDFHIKIWKFRWRKISWCNHNNTFSFAPRV